MDTTQSVLEMNNLSETTAQKILVMADLLVQKVASGATILAKRTSVRSVNGMKVGKWTCTTSTASSPQLLAQKLGLKNALKR